MARLHQDGLKKAQDVLRANRYSVDLNGVTYRRIVPSKEFYVHQWNWDSATHAMGLVHIKEEMAYAEIRSLLSGQWKNGLVPQITFNPHEKKYFPGPEFWGTEAFATGEIITSGITQPPLLGYSLAYVFTHAKDKEKAKAFVTEVLPNIMAYHRYLAIYRDPEKSGLLTIIHPWEGGTDNAPRFDSSLEAIDLTSIPQRVKDLVDRHRTDDKEGQATQRPRLHDYYRYMFLVDIFKSHHWDPAAIVRESPFAVKDVLFTSIWAASNSALVSVLREIGHDEEAAECEAYADRTRTALRKLFDYERGIFPDQVVREGRFLPVPEDTIATFLPLFAQAVTDDQLELLLGKLQDAREYATSFPVPSTPVSSPKFDPLRYWRGPTWPITNFFLIAGLLHYSEHAGAQEKAVSLLTTTLTAISKQGFFEYYDPRIAPEAGSHEALGFGSFSWTAALFIVLSHLAVEHN